MLQTCVHNKIKHPNKNVTTSKSILTEIKFNDFIQNQFRNRSSKHTTIRSHDIINVKFKIGERKMNKLPGHWRWAVS